MKLEDFISDTLTGISSGVRAANDKSGDKNFVIYNKEGNEVEFDVAVTVSEGGTAVAEGSMGAGIGIFKSNLLGRIQGGRSDKSVSRIKFKIKPRLKIE